jgi:uncharacterized protein (TIGR02466 family)
MKEFTTPIISEILDKNIFNSLTKEVNEYIKNNKNEFQTAWRCPTLSNINSNKKFRTLLLENIIKNITENYFSLYKFNSYPIKLNEVWINIAPPGAYQEQHFHLDHTVQCLFSGVLYIDAPKNSGNLRLVNPQKHNGMHMLPSPLLEDIFIQPKDGLIVSFPSWLVHEAQLNDSDKNRISISWNITKNLLNYATDNRN